MAPEQEHPPGGESTPRHGVWTTWTWWLVVVALAAGLAFLGGWLIGLAPGYTVVLVGALAVASLVWMMIAHRRREPAASFVGVVGRVAVTGVALLLVIQVLPMGRDHSNAAVTGEPAWSSPRTRELMVNACFSCHSNEVEWPWYSNVAPMSWAISDHVEEGRDAVNYSEFATSRGEADESIESIREGSMPPAFYTYFGLHSDADLSRSEQDELIAGLRATPGLAEEGDEEGDEDDEDEDDGDGD
jgi:hypothetical protein